MSLVIFRTECHVYPPLPDVVSSDQRLTDPRARLCLEVELDSTDKAKAHFRLKELSEEQECSSGGIEKGALTFALKSAHRLNDLNLTKSVELEIDLDKDVNGRTAGERFAESGLVGLPLNAVGVTSKVELDSVRIVLRPAQPDGSWTSKAPFFSLLACWRINASAGGNGQVIRGGDRIDFSAGASADISVCAGFSCIHNPAMYSIGLPSLQVRLDLDALGLTTDWQPFSWLDFGGFSHFHLNGLGRWFAGLLDIDLPNVFDGVELPDWDVDFPLALDLPLGLSFRDTSFAIRRLEGGYGIDARAKQMLLSWKGVDREFPDVELALKLESLGSAKWRYIFSARLSEWVYPALDGSGNRDPVRFSLPLDLLGLRAECFRLRVGLHSSGSSADHLKDLCVEFLLEIGGLEVFSNVTGGSAEPFFKTDLRLLARNLNVLTGPPGNIHPLRMFDNMDGVVGEPPLPFEKYYKYNLRDWGVPKRDLGVTFASDLDSPPSDDPANDYGIEIVDGEFRKGERIYLAWSQKGDQFLRALSHDLFTTPPAGEVADDAKQLNLGLEIARFGEDDIQVRLDWFEDDGKQPDLKPAGQLPPILWEHSSNPKGHKLKFEAIEDGPLVLPIAANERFDLELPPDPFTVQLPGIRVGVARPKTKSLVFRQSGDDKEAAFLFLYGGDSAANPPETRLIAKAELDFSMTGEDGSREVMRTQESPSTDDRRPFFEVGFGYAGARDTALQIVGWKQGRSPRFFQAYSPDAPAIISIAHKPAAATPANGCPRPKPPLQPPVPLSVDAFQTPRLDVEGWRMGLRFAAQKSVVDLFSGSGNDVSFSIDRIVKPDDRDYLLIFAQLELTLSGGFDVEGEIAFRFDPSDFSLTIHKAASLAITKEVEAEPGWVSQVPLPEKEKDANRFWAELDDILGLKVSVFTDRKGEKPGEPPPEPKEIDVLTLVIAEGRLALGLPPDTNMALRYTDMGQDSLSFLVDRFDLGPGGLNLSARLLSSALTVRGLKKPFALRQAGLEVRDDRLSTLSISASGALPELLDEAPVDITATFVQKRRGGRIELDELICRLGDEDSPIFSRGTRFKFEVSTLDLRYIRPSPEEDRHFFFEVSGSAQFTPDEGEFDGGLLEDLKSAKIEFVRAPLTEEFAQHLSLSVELNEPVKFNVFNIFKMEIRSLGFHPNFDFDEPSPAMIIGGQVEFADLGDVPSVEIDFHAMYLGLPKPGEVVPQVHFDGLRVEISSPDGFRIAGRVDRYDSPLLKGFAGEGTVYIPGFPEISAAFAFVRLRGAETDPWQRAWFIAAEAAKMSYQMPALPIYLRQIGLGFGYRYTLPLIKEFEQPGTLADLITNMLKALDRHQSLARIDSWTPDPDRKGESALWTIALEAVFTLGTTQAKPFDYEGKREQRLKTIIAQIIAAIRSDFTLIAAAKVWLPVSVDDFFNDEEGMRRRPLARGFTIYSAPQRRFLVHAAKGMNPYIGKEDDPWPKQVVKVLDSVHFEATMLIEPGLLHAELGWPDRLHFQFKIGSLVIDCRGGVLFRVEHDALFQGIFFSARGSMDLAGGISYGFVGFRVSAQIEVYFAARLMSALYLSRPLGSKIYSQVGLDVAVRFSVQAWLRLKIGFCRISINISFSLTLQIVIGLEVGWAGGVDLGFRGRATVLIGVFGRSLRASVAVGLNEGGVIAARAALAPYMGPFLEPGEPPRVPDGNPLGGVAGRAAVAETASRRTMALAAKADAIAETVRELFVTSHVVSSDEEYTYVWIMPAPGSPYFYPVGTESPGSIEGADGWQTYAWLDVPETADEESIVEYLKPTFVEKGPEGEGEWDLRWAPKSHGEPIELAAAHGKSMEMESQSGATSQLNLQQTLVGCYPVCDDDLEGPNDDWFPECWPNRRPDLLPLDAAESCAVGAEPLEDGRTLDPSGSAGGPRRELDPKRKYDAAVIRAMQEEELSDARRQALGNQSFVMQGFYDDLLALTECGPAGEVCAALNRQANAQRPSIIHLGAVIRIKGKVPKWVVRRDADAYPKLWFRDGVEPTAVPTNKEDAVSVMPVVDFEAANFQSHPPVFSDAEAYFDDELIALRWRLGWGGDPTGPARADGVDNRPEAFLRSYQIQFVDLVRNSTLKSTTSKPADLLVDERSSGDGSGEPKRVRPRFQVTVPLSELFEDEVASGQQLRRIGVTVTPIDQVGRLGESYTFTLDQEPSLTPLPADEAKCMLRPAEESTEDDSFVAHLSWREPSIPPQRGISKTDNWQIVFRPLRETPVGAYPDDAAEATERGLMSVTGQALQEGDIVLRLGESKNGKGPWTKEPPKRGAGTDDTLESVDFLHNVYFDPAKFEVPSASDKVYQPYPGWDVIDHEGNKLAVNDPLVADLLSFLKGLSPEERFRKGERPVVGKAWRLFLRAETRRRRKHGGEASTYSGLSPVRLTALLKPDVTTASSESLASETAGKGGPKGLDERPLPHFEWPRRNLPAAARQISMPRAISGGLHIPQLKREGDKHVLRYVAEPSRARAITLEWSAVQAIVPEADLVRPVGAEVTLETFGYESIAEYQVHETPLDALLNADLDPDSGFRPPWRQITRIKPVDRSSAGQVPDNMGDTQNWVAWTPAYAKTLEWLNQSGIPEKEWSRAWPAWYSWAESELLWPPEAGDFEDDLLKSSNADNDERAPFEVLGQADAEPIKKLAAWRDLGEQAAGGRMHPYLCILVGILVDRRAYQEIGDELKMGPLYNVQASTGQPVQITDPLAWLRANNDAVDPYGWAALSHLGLNVTLSLRDKDTGLLYEQSVIRKELEKAKQILKAEIKLHFEDGQLPEWYTELVDRHLSLDYPIQTTWSARADAGIANLDDAALWMVQISLRPRPQQQFGYTLVQVKPKRTKDAEGNCVVERPAAELTAPHDLRMVFLDASRPAVTLEKGDSFSTKAFFVEPETDVDCKPRSKYRILIQHLEFGRTAADLGGWSSHVDISPETFEPLPCLADTEPGDISPFGRFAVPEHSWKSHFFAEKDENPGQFGRILAALGRAFGRKEVPEGEDGGQTKTPEQIRDALRREPDIHKIYLAWSARFHSSAPLSEDESITLAAPKQADPMHIAADRQGVIRVTRPVEEEWASTRSFAVTATGRYDRLRRAMLGEEIQPITLSMASSVRADAQLSRIRRVEPPQVLGQRGIQDAEGRWFNELAVATHAEEALTNSNLEVAKKLEFGVVMRRYVREFRYQSWLETFRGTLPPDAPAPALPGPAELKIPDEYQRPDLSESRNTFLAHVPKSRWGASRHVTPAEPFYYDVQVEVAATAADQRSITKQIPLSPGQPDSPKPCDPKTQPYKLGRIPSWQVVDGDIHQKFGDWLKKPADGEDRRAIRDETVIAHALPDGWNVRIRVPRYFESLVAESTGDAGYFRAEIAPHSVGRLPDEGLSLHILRDQAGSKEAIGAIAVSHEEGFRSTVVSREFEMPDELIVDTSNWPEGTWLETALYRIAERQEVGEEVLTGGGHKFPSDILRLPELLVEPGSALLGANALPESGPLSQLAPLAMRLSFDDANSRLALSHVHEGPTWLMRPSSRIGSDQVGYTQGEMALALQMMVSWPRRHAAAVISYDISRAEADGTTAPALRVLLRIVEQGGHLYLGEVGQDYEIDDGEWNRLTTARLALWHRTKGEGDPSWRKVEGPLTVLAKDMLLLLADQDSDDAEFVRVVETAAKMLHPNMASDPAQQRSIRLLAEALAGKSYPRTRIPKPDIYAQRGNEPRTLWAKGDEADES